MRYCSRLRIFVFSRGFFSSTFAYVMTIDIGYVSPAVYSCLLKEPMMLLFLILRLCKYLFLMFTLENKLKEEPGKYCDR